MPRRAQDRDKPEHPFQDGAPFFATPPLAGKDKEEDPAVQRRQHANKRKKKADRISRLKPIDERKHEHGHVQSERRIQKVRNRLLHRTLRAWVPE